MISQFSIASIQVNLLIFTDYSFVLKVLGIGWLSTTFTYRIKHRNVNEYKWNAILFGIAI